VLLVINVDWYFLMHWLDRALSLRDAGYKVHLATSFTSKKNRVVIEGYGIKCMPVPFKRSSINPFGEIGAIRELVRAFRAVNPDIVHCVTVKPILYGGVLCRLFKVPCIHSVVGLGGLLTHNRSKMSLIWPLLKPMLRQAIRDIATFENCHDRDWLRREGVVAEKSIVLPGAGVDTERYRYAEIPSVGALKILFAARLLRSKGLQLLFEVVRELKKKGLLVELHVAGIIDGDSNDSIPMHMIRSWSNSGDIVWHGSVDDMENLIVECHVVCLPTTYGEGIPRILIEASSCGRPVVTTSVPGCSEYVRNGEDGLLVAPGSCRELMDALILLLSDRSLCSKMGLAGRKKVESFYNKDIIIRRTVEIYDDILN